MTEPKTLDERQETYMVSMIAVGGSCVDLSDALGCADCPKFNQECDGFNDNLEAQKEWLRKYELQKQGKLTFGDLAVGECFVCVEKSGTPMFIVKKKGSDHIYSLDPHKAATLEEILVLTAMLCGTALFVLAAKTWQNHIYVRDPSKVNYGD